MGVTLGSGLLVGDPDTNQASTGPFNFELADLSPRKAFTGFVGILDLKPITVTGAALKVVETALTVANDDVNAYAINVGYDLAEVGMKSGVGEVYWVERAGRDANSRKTPVDNYGVRIQASPVENFNAGAEFCYQRTKQLINTASNLQDEAARNRGDSNTALLLNAGLTMPDVVMAPSISVDYTRLSKNWNAMMEDLTPADIANALFPGTNVQCIGATLAMKPMTDLVASLRFATFRSVKEINAFANNWNAAYTMDGNKRHLGNELDLHLTYDYSEDVQFGLMGGIFAPGRAFAPVNRKDATQVIGSMKVTF